MRYRNFENILDQQAKLAETTGRIEEVIKQESILLQIRAEQYFRKRTEAIQNIYNSLLNLRNMALKIAHNDPTNYRDQLLNATNEFRERYDANRIWLSNSLAEEFNSIAVKISNQAFAFMQAEVTLSNLRTVSKTMLDRAIQQQEEFYKFIIQDIPSEFEQIVRTVVEHVNPDSSNNVFNSGANKVGIG